MKLTLNGIWFALMAAFFLTPGARAFPPAPQVLIYGLVKDQYGQPLANPADTVILQTASGAPVVAKIQPNLAVGINYAIWVPMDSGLSLPLYEADALTNGEPYTLYVTDGGATNLPLEMAVATFKIAPPGQTILQNLTLGTDSNHDGIPDSWEQAFLQSLGLNIAQGSINGNGIYTSDGRTLLQEYLLGNFPYNSNAFSVAIISQNRGSSVLSFTATSGRTYSVCGSSDLKTWTPLSFTVPSVGAQVINSYSPSSSQALQIQTMQPTNAPQMQFFRLLLQ